MLRAILFDFNGVLVDDEPVHLQLVGRVLQEEGLEFDTVDYRAEYVGLSDQECFAAYLERSHEASSPLRVQRLVARKARYYQEVMHRRGYPFFPGAIELVEEAYEAGVALGLVSGARREEVDEALAQAALSSRFKVVVTTEDVDRGKPHPEGYRLGLEQLNTLPPLPQRLIHPHEVLAIEDTPRGLRAALSAGLVTLGLAQTFSRAEMVDADFVVEGLGGSNFAALQRQYAEVSRS